MKENQQGYRTQLKGIKQISLDFTSYKLIHVTRLWCFTKKQTRKIEPMVTDICMVHITSRI